MTGLTKEAVGIVAPMTCRQCGGDIKILAHGASYEHEARCMVICTECDSEFVVIVRMALTKGAVVPRDRKNGVDRG